MLFTDKHANKINSGCLAMVLIPLENQPPLAVDPNRVPAFKPARKRFEPISRRAAQIGLAARIVNQLQLSEQTIRDIRWNVFAVPIMKIKIA
jgi:hypothetical protein